MVKSKKYKHLHLVYNFTTPLNAPIKEIAVITVVHELKPKKMGIWHQRVDKT